MDLATKWFDPEIDSSLRAISGVSQEKSMQVCQAILSEYPGDYSPYNSGPSRMLPTK
jgi:hypothetical protein